MPGYLKQSTAAQSRAIGPFVDSTDYQTAETGLTIANTDIKLVVNGGASANKNSGGGTHRVNGIYGITFDATDTATVGEIEISVVVAGALPVFDKFFVLEEAVYDALFAASAPGYLQPTTAGGTLDVSATGEAGLDWANIGSPTTAVNLSATNIDVDQVVASVSGNVGGNVTGSVGSVTGLTNATIADAVWDEDATGHQTQGTFGQAIGDPVADTNSIYKAVVTDATGATVGVDVVAIKAETVTILADTDNIQTRLPAALVSGRMDASVGAMAADVLTAAATAADFTTEIQTGLATAANLSTLQTTANDILTDTAEIGVAGAGLTNINLPNQTMDITGSLSGSVGSVTGLTVAHIDAAISTRATPAQVNAEVVDALNVDTYAEPTGVPAATASLVSKIGRLYQVLRNRLEVTATDKTLYDDAGAALWKKALSDDGTTYTEGEGEAP